MSIDKKSSMFREAKSKTLARTVKIDTVENANEATKELLKRFGTLKHRDAKVHTKRATVLAATRAEMIAKKTKKPKMRRDKLRIARMYRKVAKKMVLD